MATFYNVITMGLMVMGRGRLEESFHLSKIVS